MNVLVKRDSLCAIMRKKFAEILALTLSILSAMVQAHLDFYLSSFLSVCLPDKNLDSEQWVSIWSSASVWDY